MLEGKTVNCKDVGLLSFFYPSFVIKDTLFFDHDKSVIYTGSMKKNMVEYLKNNTKTFINTVGPYTVDLESEEELIDFVYSKWGKEPKDGVRDLLLNLQRSDLLIYLKKYWMVGKSDLDSMDVTIFDLFKSFLKSKSECYSVYFRLLEYVDPIVLEHSIFTFLGKVASVDDVEVSAYYKKILLDFKSKNGNKIKKLCLDYLDRKDTDKRLSILWLISQF